MTDTIEQLGSSILAITTQIEQLNAKLSPLRKELMGQLATAQQKKVKLPNGGSISYIKKPQRKGKIVETERLANLKEAVRNQRSELEDTNADTIYEHKQAIFKHEHAIRELLADPFLLELEEQLADAEKEARAIQAPVEYTLRISPPKPEPTDLGFDDELIAQIQSEANNAVNRCNKRFTKNMLVKWLQSLNSQLPKDEVLALWQTRLDGHIAYWSNKDA